jgi:hypothetical protein
MTRLGPVAGLSYLSVLVSLLAISAAPAARAICPDGSTRTCTLSGCPGSQTCFNNIWSACDTSMAGTLTGSKTNGAGTAFSSPGATITGAGKTSAAGATSYSWCLTEGTYTLTSSVPANYSVRSTTQGSPVTSGTSANVTVLAGTTVDLSWKYDPANSLRVSGVSSPRNAGDSGNVVVTPIDAYGFPAQGYAGTVSISAPTDPQFSAASTSHTYVAADSGSYTVVRDY